MGLDRAGAGVRVRASVRVRVRVRVRVGRHADLARRDEWRLTLALTLTLTP